MVGIPTTRQLLHRPNISFQASSLSRVTRVSCNELERRTLRHQTIHHTLYKLNLVLDRKVDEIRIDQYTIRRSEVGIVGEEKAGW